VPLIAYTEGIEDSGAGCRDRPRTSRNTTRTSRSDVRCADRAALRRASVGTEWLAVPVLLSQDRSRSRVAATHGTVTPIVVMTIVYLASRSG
jgi:hypothetical protein